MQYEARVQSCGKDLSARSWRELVARIKVHVVKMVISANDVKVCTQGLQWHLCLCVREVSLLCPPQLLLIEKAYHLLLLN